MNAPSFRIVDAAWPDDVAALRSVREPVFVVEQNVPVEEEWDALDAESVHVLALDGDGRAIGTGRLTPQQRIGRMAVLREWRGRGVGAAIVEALLAHARRLGYATIELHAQTHAVPFYAGFGFAAYGDEFVECDIRHRHMHLDLPYLDTRPPSAPRPLAASDRRDAIDATLAVLTDTAHGLDLISRDLDPLLLDRPDALAQLRRIALSGARARIRLLVQEPDGAIASGHRLILLAQRLPSAFALRTPVDPIDRQFAGAFVANDRGGWFERPLASRFDGDGSRYAPGRHAQLLAQFEQIWERSEPASGLRRLDL